MALAVLIQLTLPAVTLRAERAREVSCLSLSVGGDASSSTAIDHAQGCIHCPAQACGGAASPAFGQRVVIGIAGPVLIGWRVALGGQLLQRPLQTGPPSASFFA